MTTICFDVLTQENNFGTSKLEILFEFADWATNLPLWVLYHHEPYSWRVLCHLWAAWGAPCPSQGQQSPNGNSKQGPRGSAGPSAWECSHRPGRPWEPWAQFSKLKRLWLNQRTSKQSLIYLFSFALTTCTNTPRLTFFHIQFYSLFLKSPHCMFVLQLKQQGTHAQSRGEGAWPLLHGTSLALLAGTDGGMPMPCHLPPHWRADMNDPALGHWDTPSREQQAEHSSLSGYGTVSPSSSLSLYDTMTYMITVCCGKSQFLVQI